MLFRVCMYRMYIFCEFPQGQPFYLHRAIAILLWLPFIFITRAHMQERVNKTVLRF